MLFSAAAASLVNKITTAWAVAHSDIPVLLTNDRRPTYDELVAAGQTSPCMLHVEVRGGRQYIAAFGSLGNNRYLQSGEVILRIFVPAQTGETLARSLADDASAILIGYRDGDLWVTDSAPASGEASEEDGNFYQMDVIASFQVFLTG